MKASPPLYNQILKCIEVFIDKHKKAYAALIDSIIIANIDLKSVVRFKHVILFQNKSCYTTRAPEVFQRKL